MSTLTIAITNFRLPQIILSRDPGIYGEAGGAPDGSVPMFAGKLYLAPTLEDGALKTLEAGEELARNTVGCHLVFNTDLFQDIAVPAGDSVDEREFLGRFCDLLSYASRRGVDYIPPDGWHTEGKRVVRGGNTGRGPILTNRELVRLVEHGMQRLYDPASQHDERLLTALRWFLGWNDGQGIDLKFVRLWIVLEMLALNYWKTRPNKPKHKFEMVFQYLRDIALPKLEELPLRPMYDARNTLVHGDPDSAEAMMCKWFGDYVEKRRNELDNGPFEVFSDTASSPDRKRYNHCMFEGVHMLSRLIEKVFLNRFDCEDCYFYHLPYHSVWAP